MCLAVTRPFSYLIQRNLHITMELRNQIDTSSYPKGYWDVVQGDSDSINTRHSSLIINTEYKYNCIKFLVIIHIIFWSIIDPTSILIHISIVLWHSFRLCTLFSDSITSCGICIIMNGSVIESAMSNTEFTRCVAHPVPLLGLARFCKCTHQHGWGYSLWRSICYRNICHAAFGCSHCCWSGEWDDCKRYPMCLVNTTRCGWLVSACLPTVLGSSI